MMTISKHMIFDTVNALGVETVAGIAQVNWVSEQDVMDTIKATSEISVVNGTVKINN